MILDIIIITVLIAIAAALLILELFFLPGLSIAGFFSVAFYGFALYYTIAHMGITVGIITLLIAAIITIALIWYFMRSRTLDKMSLNTNIDATAPTKIDSSVQVGNQGIALSRLNPMGRVMIGNRTVEARSLEFIEEGSQVVVTKIERTTVTVEQAPIETNNN